MGLPICLEPPYLEVEFDLTRDDAVKILSEWMETYSERHKEEVK